MDALRWDKLAKAVAEGTNRRALFPGLAALGLILVGGAETEATPDTKCRPRCSECQRCHPGVCKNNRHGRRVCHRGNCKKLFDGIPCSVGTCLSGACVP